MQKRITFDDFIGTRKVHTHSLEFDDLLETFGIEREEQQFYIGYEYMGYWILFDMRSASFYSMMYCEEKVDYTLAALETWLFSQCEGELNWDYHNELKMLDPQLG